MISFRSPAKINLFLRVLNKRTDGYHELASIFQVVDLCDYLTFEKSSQDSFSTNDNQLPLDQHNLVLRALALFRAKTNQYFPISIHLEKNIPVEAGLGGGSSNAATTLFALNQMAGFILSNEELQNLSAEIGSDVPFFFSLGTAYCQGRGEIFENISPMHQRYTICKPRIGLSTPAVFKAFQLEDRSSMDPQFLLSEMLAKRPIYLNDLEKAACRVEPSLQLFKASLRVHGYQHVFMSGSGSSFVCIGEAASFPDVDFAATVMPISRLHGTWY